MISGIIFYLLFLIFIIILSRSASKRDDIKIVVFIICIMSLLSGLRGISVGIDTKSYTEVFEMILLNAREELSWTGIENSFVTLCSILQKINTSPLFLFVLFSFLINGLIIARFWDYRYVASFTWMMIAYYIGFYLMTFNIMRQFCAVAIIFWGTRFIDRKKYIPFLICVLGGFIFHRSSIIGAGFILIDIFSWNKLRKYNQLFLLSSVLFIPVIGLYLYRNSFRFLKYFRTIHLDFGLMVAVKVVLFVVSTYGLYNMFRIYILKRICSGKPVLIPDYRIRQISWYYLLGLIISVLGYLFSYMNRVGLVFHVFECVYIGIVVKVRKDKRVWQVIYSLLLMYIFIMDMLGDGQGVLPYQFFWQ